MDIVAADRVMPAGQRSLGPMGKHTPTFLGVLRKEGTCQRVVGHLLCFQNHPKGPPQTKTHTPLLKAAMTS